ncbi:hypothetical protein QTP86_019359 [Hemibagrus guttatus]|nr:hypothetical protein QTP86_019359 [Hemibagrus guttatus]
MGLGSVLSYFTLAIFIQYSCSQTLIQSDPVIIKPDQSHKLTCTASGLDIGTTGWLGSDRRLEKDWNLLQLSNVHGEELTQPASMTVQPGQSLSIHCKVSYSVTSYHTAWIRQPAGKALEWIGNINTDGNTYYSDKLKNKFSISRDTSTNTITIGGQNMQTEDTAVYYCAREPHSDTVSCSAAQKPHHYSLL